MELPVVWSLLLGVAVALVGILTLVEPAGPVAGPAADRFPGRFTGWD